MSVPACEYCESRKARSICGHPESPRFNTQIQPDGSCDRFSPHLAVQEIDAAWLAYRGSEKPEQRRDAIERMGAALEAAMSPEDEFRGHMRRAFVLMVQASHPAGIPEAAARALATQSYERSLDVVSETNINLEGWWAAKFLRLDCIYADQAETVEAESGVQSAIDYLRNKIARVGDDSPIPLICTRWELAQRLASIGDTPGARAQYEFIDRAGVSEPDSPEVEQSYKQLARQELDKQTGGRRVAQGRDDGEARASTGASRCFVATAAMGSNATPEVEALAAYRDRVLRGTWPGNLLIAWYESWSPPAARWLERRERAKAFVRIGLIRPLVWLICRRG